MVELKKQNYKLEEINCAYYKDKKLVIIETQFLIKLMFIKSKIQHRPKKIIVIIKELIKQFELIKLMI